MRPHLERAATAASSTYDRRDLRWPRALRWSQSPTAHMRSWPHGPATAEEVAGSSVGCLAQLLQAGAEVEEKPRRAAMPPARMTEEREVATPRAPSPAASFPQRHLPPGEVRQGEWLADPAPPGEVATSFLCPLPPNEIWRGCAPRVR
jgi:hypothetical protein